MSEAELTKKVIKLLEDNGHLVFKTKRKTERRSFQNGTPDLIVCSSKGLFFAFELKTEKGNLRKSQIIVRDKFPKRQLFLQWRILRPSNYIEILKTKDLIP